MQVVRQTKPGLCLAACVAMLTDRTLEEVVEQCGLETINGVEHISDKMAIISLATHGLCYGLRIGPGSPSPDGIQIVEFLVNINILHAPAILTVPSLTLRGFNHAVVWDNNQKKVLDPWYDDPKPLTDYPIILEWTPISKI